MEVSHKVCDNPIAIMFALSPLFVFMAIYLGMSIIANDFYSVPVTVAFLVASVYAICITKGTLNKRIEIFSKGAGSKNMMLMLWIFLLAGAFASSAKSVGAVDSTVNFTLSVLPPSFLLPGIFLASCFISFSIGTSVGTIAALAPIGIGLAEQTGLDIALMTAAIVGGSYFGDNLSFISDTTIVATQTQECKMSDKFKVNIRIVLPAALVVLAIYFFMGVNLVGGMEPKPFNFIQVVPYLIVILSALMGFHVMIVLSLGLFLTGIIGISQGTFDVFGWFNSMAEGMLGMSELLIMTLLAAGMLAIIRHNGGIDYVISKLTRFVSGKKSAEYSIAFLVTLVNVCTANNTVAIITTGHLAKDIADKYGVDRRKSASILDTMSCFAQGLLPYGAQMLMAASMAHVSGISIIGFLYYNMAIGLSVVIAIWLRRPRKYS